MIEIRNLSKHFGPARAVDDVSFSVQRGEVLGFLGPNGAGKSTTMKVLTGFLAPTGGSATVCGHDVVRERVAAQRRIGYLPEGAPLYPDMTPNSLLRFVAEAHGIERGRRATRIAEVVDLVHLGDVMQQRIETLSKGFKRRVGLACALIHDPDVLILDEPTDGLDPNQKHDVRALIGRMSEGKVIVLSTHILEEVEAVCSRAIIISQGRLCFDGSPADLRARSRHHRAVMVHVASNDGVSDLCNLAGVIGTEELPGEGDLRRVVLFPREGANLVREVHEKIRTSALPVDHVEVLEGRLDDVFREITGERSIEEVTA